MKTRKIKEAFEDLQYDNEIFRSKICALSSLIVILKDKLDQTKDDEEKNKLNAMIDRSASMISILQSRIR